MILNAVLVPAHKELGSTAPRNKGGEGSRTAIGEAAQYTLVENS